ncbi:MAG: YggU family protein [Chloroflexi bacterium]|nr:MAG: YggU family protein [Chloroflexota bacterium]
MKKIKFHITKAERGAAFTVVVIPRAKRNEIVGRYGDAIKVKIAAPPEKGKANKELISFLSEKLGVEKSRLEIVAGATSRSKVVSVIGMSPQEVEERLLS